ncbi:hypothetical protein CCACVL1_11571 [Corchorus capsularis]|uniref:Uncharacterized protein n=1 Tax=Corchorus capsularis TaxID=210143 RepID=A0A1R3IKI8_COCAP|nr:hypothetical protein CCACVL1_11571 [Corchorus capsularis]
MAAKRKRSPSTSPVPTPSVAMASTTPPATPSATLSPTLRRFKRSNSRLQSILAARPHAAKNINKLRISVVNLLVRDRAEAFIRTKPFKGKHIRVNEGCDILVEGCSKKEKISFNISFNNTSSNTVSNIVSNA